MDCVATNDGKPVSLVSICTICPIAYADEARQIAASNFLKANPEEMLTTKLGPIGEDRVTHIWCCRSDYEHAIPIQLETLRKANREWTAGFAAYVEGLKTMDLPLSLTLMLTIIGEEAEVLSILGLEVK